MDRASLYLHIPRDYFTCMGDGLRWSADGEAIEREDGRTFTFAAAVTAFAEGFAALRPLVHFGHLLHLLRILNGQTCTVNDAGEAHRLSTAFQSAGKNYRNAGAFFAAACADVPAAAGWVSAAELAQRVSFRILGLAVGPPVDVEGAEKPPLGPAAFEAKVLRATAAYDADALRHWFRHGRGPLMDAATAVAEAVRRAPRTLADLLEDASRRQRLAGAAAFVEQLTGALALPPRRLARPELPLGGYADVTTRGGPEQILPSQFALDELEFVRRCAEQELLYYRREEPHDRTRENLVVLLDQGVRTWGDVRLVLAAAVFALGRLAGARRLPFLVAATSSGGAAQDPMEMDEGVFSALLESSDLSADPGATLGKVLAEETEAVRDVVLLTHPRSLGEPAVRSAARTVRPGSRLFAVAVDGRGDVEFSEIRRDAPVRLSRFHVDLNRTAPPPAVRAAPPDARTPWRGDVEPVPFPFVLGVAKRGAFHFDFDWEGKWLVTATEQGMLHATRTDGLGGEVLPRPFLDGRLVTSAQGIISTPGGAAVVGSVPSPLEGDLAVVAHYDFEGRNCRAYSLGWLPGRPWLWHYFRDLHSVVVESGDRRRAVDLSTGGRLLASGVPDDRPSRAIEACERVQRDAKQAAKYRPGDAERCYLFRASGEVHVDGEAGPWAPFVPLSDGRPMLQGCQLIEGRRRGDTLALMVDDGAAAGPLQQRLCLFRGPAGTPLAVYRHHPSFDGFTLSPDGRLLARQIGMSRMEVRSIAGGPALALTPARRDPWKPMATLGDRWLLLQSGPHGHLIRWHAGRLLCSYTKRYSSVYLAGQLGWSPAASEIFTTRIQPPPAFLAYDPVRFRTTAVGAVIVAVDAHGQTAVFEREGRLVCMFAAVADRLAAWAPPDVRYGTAALLGGPPTPGAEEAIGRALLEGWQRSEGRRP